MKYAILLLLMVGCTPVKDYETGYVTTGNPDNSYLDTCRVYCCGD